MSNIISFLVIPFTRNEDGTVVPGEAKEAQNGDIAWRHARAAAAAPGHVGAIALSRSGKQELGTVANGVVLAIFGEVDLGAAIAG